MSSAPAPPPRRTHPLFWVSSTYFAEGFPYSFVNNIVEIMFQQMGASLRVIGLTSLFHLPWNLKFLWGPFLDQYETKRRWLVGVEAGLSVLLIVLALLVGTVKAITMGLVVALFLIAFLSATHDIAIDGYYLEALDKDEQAAFVGLRAGFYRLAGLALGGPLLAVIGSTGWFVGLLLVAGIVVFLTIYHAWLLPHAEERRGPFSDLLRLMARPKILSAAGVVALILAANQQFGLLSSVARVVGFHRWPVVGSLSFSQWVALLLLLTLIVGVVLVRRKFREQRSANSSYIQAFTSFMAQPSASLLLAFVVLFRTGESFLTKMRWPFLNQEVKMELQAFGVINGTYGTVASILATLGGGWLISRFGLRRCIWPFVVAQNVLNLLYMWIGTATDPALTSTTTLIAVIVSEHIGAGLGTAVFMVYLMRCCDPEHKAGHMAILTALMSVSFTIAGVASGFLAEELGFASYFGFTFLATIPSMLLIPFLPYLDGRETGSVPPN